MNLVELVTFVDTAIQLSDVILRTRNRKLKDKKFRRLWISHPSEEASYLWTSDPDRHGKEIYDFGEYKEYNSEFSKPAVVKIWMHAFVGHGKKIKRSILARVSTSKPVVWSETKAKWIDIDVDKKYVKKIKKIIGNYSPSDGDIKYRPKDNDNEDIENSISIKEINEHCREKGIQQPDWELEDTYYRKWGCE